MSSHLYTHQYISLPDPVAVDAAHRRQYECSNFFFKHALQLGPLDWSAPLRVGLPTPPGEMNSVAYNTTLPSGYGPQSFATSVPKYTKVPNKIYDPSTCVSAVSGSTFESTVKGVSASANETDVQKQSEESIASYLQIPCTINKSKGSLAEFAAQVGSLAVSTISLSFVPVCLSER